MNVPTLYVVVRRDLALDDIMPQAMHAAMKAMFLAGLGVGAACSSAYPTSWLFEEAVKMHHDWMDDAKSPILIIKGARNEDKLRKLQGRLVTKKVDHVTWAEPDEGPLKGQLTALALLPREKDDKLLNDFQNLRWNMVPAFQETEQFQGEMVFNATTAHYMTRVRTRPQSGQYARQGNQFVFSPDDKGQQIIISWPLGQPEAKEITVL